jgi:ribosomal protein L23
VVKTKTIEKEIVKYTFLVAKNANKNDIKEALCKLYGINRDDILKVNTMRVPPKYRAVRGLVRKPFKKAIVTLKSGVRLQLK